MFRSAVPSTVIAPPVSKATRTVQFSVEEDKGERMTKAKPKRATRSKVRVQSIPPLVVALHVTCVCTLSDSN